MKASRQAIRERGRFLFVLSGGTTPEGLYRLLAGDEYRCRIDWSGVEFFWGDERPVPPDHPDSNYGMAARALLGPLEIPEAQVHRMKGEVPDLDRAARDYEMEIAGVCRTPVEGTPPAFDLVLLGMGSDGHTASLFPHTRALREDRRWVVPNPVPQLNTPRITLTKSILNQAHHTVFLVLGAGKRRVLSQVLEGPEDGERLPSQLIRPTSGRVTWLVDHAAGADLTGSLSESS